MIIIPELKTVVILVPRTGSGSLRRAIAKRHPDSMLLYRHMEADGVPDGYDRWRRVGVIRHPLSRLYSLWSFLRDLPPALRRAWPYWAKLQSASADQPFEDWLVANERVFTDPFMGDDGLPYIPGFNVRHRLPENRKSQFHYLRPDLGTEIYAFEHLDLLAAELDADLEHHNSTGAGELIAINSLHREARNHFYSYFGWDLSEWDRRRHESERCAAMLKRRAAA